MSNRSRAIADDIAESEASTEAKNRATDTWLKERTPQLGPSPEVTGDWRCWKCPNTTHFIGYDHDGYGGPSACDCGAFDEDDEGSGAECSCSTVLKQSFTVVHGATEEGFDGEIIYSAFEGGGQDAEIGSYDTIECAACGAIVWNEVPPGDGQ